MDIVLHAGVHCTDEDRLVRCLLRNLDLLVARGVAVPGPSRYRQMLRDAVHAAEEDAAQPAPPGDLLTAIPGQDGAERLVLSAEHFFAVPNYVLEDGQFYPKAERRLAALARLFPETRLTLCLGLRDPATFLPALFARSDRDDVLDLLRGSDAMQLRWSDLIQRLRFAHPELSILLWCNEDTPLIWGQIVREVAGLEPGAKIAGAFDVLAEIMHREGMQRFRTYLQAHPVMSESQKRRAIAAFLDKYALTDAIEEELDLPGWDATYVDALSAAYEIDMRVIQDMPGVRMLLP